tara:strand:- start:317 stop:490 length:174 start_codon:yes stop_codon:yes gene_type:complete
VPRVYVPNPAEKTINEALKELYLLKTAIKTESEEKISNRIDKIRQALMDVAEGLKNP